MATAAAPGRVPARLHYRVQLRFVTEEQLFTPGPLTTPNPKSLRLEVHAAGEEADATVTDGEVLGATHPARPARSCGLWARVRGAAVGKDARGRAGVSRALVPGRASGACAGVHPDGLWGEDPRPEKAQRIQWGLYCSQRSWTPGTERP